jgi:hypothetical protein
MMSQIQALGNQEFWGVLLNDGKIKAGLATIQPQQLAIVPGAADLVAPLQRARGFSFWGHRSGEKGAKFYLGATCSNAADAGVLQTKVSDLWKQGGKTLVEMARGAVAAQPEVQGLDGMLDDLSRSFAVERKGTLAYASVELSSKTVQALRNSKKSWPPEVSIPPRSVARRSIGRRYFNRRYNPARRARPFFPPRAC